MNSAKHKAQTPSRRTQQHSSSISSGGVSSISTYAEQFAYLRLQKEDAEDKLKKINEQLTECEDRLVDLMESADISALKTTAGHGLSLRGVCYPNIENREEFLGWVHANKLESSLSMHHSTLKALCKEQLENARPLPDGVTAYMKQRITFRRGHGV